MKKISGSTYFNKWFPRIWFGLLGIFALVGFITGKGEDRFFIPIFPIIMAVFGFVLFKRLIWDLADEVYDEGDSLLFKKGKKEQRVFLKEIINISYAHMSSPERVVIHVRNEGNFGKELAFSLPTRINPFSKSPIVAELIERVDHARNT